MRHYASLSSKQKAANGAPGHNTLTEDSHFDARFSAYLRCESCLNNVYFDVLHRMHSHLIDAVVDTVSNFKILIISRPMRC